MHRSLLPFILAGLGFTLVALAINLPLFEWQISEIITDLPPEVHFNPSPWTTKLGESLDNDTYIQVYVSNDGLPCRPERLTSIVKRSRNDEMLERIALNVDQKIIPWLSESSKFGLVLFLSAAYIWWFTMSYKRPISEAVISTVAAVIISCFLINIWRLFFHPTGAYVCSGLNGTLTFNARLSKVHYETISVFLTGILFELGALGIMLRQIVRAVIERKTASNS